MGIGKFGSSGFFAFNGTQNGQDFNLDSPALHQIEIASHVNVDPIQHELHFGRILSADDLEFETADVRSCTCGRQDHP